MLANLCVLLASLGIGHMTDAKLDFFVTVPDGTPKDAVVYLCGSHPSLGAWQAPGVPMERMDDGRFHRAIELPAGVKIEYKFTLGTWDSVEKSATGIDIANRRLAVGGPAKIEVTIAAWASKSSKAAADRSAKGAKRLSGLIRYHSDFPSKRLSSPRSLVVYLPSSYEAKPAAQKRYPVLYMHDGQNLFDASTSFLGIEWGADEAAESLVKAGKIEPLIIVGIYNTPARMDEYTPDRDDERGAGGNGDLYARFLVEEVKPFIDKTYRTLPDRANTGVAGSSLGGLISLYICKEYPEVFSRCGVISPALMWNHASFLESLAKDPSWMKNVRFWVDMGTAEGRQVKGFSEGIRRTRQLVKIFESAGLKADRDFAYREVEGGEHNEAAWQKRFPDVLRFLLADTPENPHR
ncbi:MAG: esterase [Planctomycetia bacterium]|jgi:predicted alpha/beta superfamily hydrolase|nr:esterase [Planctomycetia bacterium]MCC7314219.1 esterase [Planctomycetota bacterium]OQZ05601.1 MAG: hypothetical protein B6D36_09305 [Planctomycetes bacterium UTPLA1]